MGQAASYPIAERGAGREIGSQGSGV